MIDLVATPLPPVTADHDCRDTWEPVARARGSAPFEEMTFTIRRCRVCGLGFTDPVPSQSTAPALYGSRDSNDFQQGDSGLVSSIKALVARRDARAFVGAEASTIIDYGCGNGAFVAAMASMRPGAVVIGADLHDEPPAGLRPDQYVPYRRLQEWNGRADLVLVRHVLEHTYDPLVLLCRLGDLLRPGGTVVIEVPALDAAIRPLWGRDWAGFYVPYHTLHFTPASLSRLVAAAGLSVDRVSGAELPMMGRSLQSRLQSGYGLPLFAVGALLHPLQLTMGRITGRPACIRLWATRL